MTDFVQPIMFCQVLWCIAFSSSLGLIMYFVSYLVNKILFKLLFMKLILYYR